MILMVIMVLMMMVMVMLKTRKGLEEATLVTNLGATMMFFYDYDGECDVD